MRTSWRGKRFSTWASRGVWAVTDQGLFAVSNFMLNVLLARWLPPAEYGAFALCYALLLLLGTVHIGLITEPMQVYGAGKHRERLPNYLRWLFRAHVYFSLLGSLVFVLIVAILLQLKQPVLAKTILVLAATSPVILFYWLLRRACYIEMRPQVAAQAGAIYLALMVFVAYVLKKYDSLSLVSAFWVMAIASLFAAMWVWVHIPLRSVRGSPASFERDNLADHWHYGRWAATSGLLAWVPTNLVYLALPVWHGLEANGALRAIINLITPIQQLNAALGPVLLPVLVRARAKGPLEIRKIVWLFTALLCGVAFFYWIVLATNASNVLRLFYGSKYEAYAPLLLLVGAAGFANVFLVTYSTALRAIEHPKKVAHAYAWSSAILLAVGLVLIWRFGTGGAVVGFVLASVAPTVFVLRYFRDYFRVPA